MNQYHFYRERRTSKKLKKQIRFSLFIALLLCHSFTNTRTTNVSAETEIKWTPNEEPKQQQGEGSDILGSESAPQQAEQEKQQPAAGGDTASAPPPPQPASGPLPLSQRQREQLMQLEQVIRQSPNPQETLVQAAQANQMDPNELLDLLQRNHNDMAMAQGGAGGGGTMRRPTNVVLKTLSSTAVVLSGLASKHPKAFGLTVASALLLSYVAIQAPRTGLIVSERRSLLSNGPTAFWCPPPAFVQRRYLDQESGLISKHQEQQPRHKKRTGYDAELWSEIVPLIEEQEDDVSAAVCWYSPKQLRQHKIHTSVKRAASAQVTLRARDLAAFMVAKTANSQVGGSSRRRRTKSGKPDDSSKSGVADDDETDEEEKVDNEEEEDEEVGHDDELVAEVTDLLLDHASDVLSARQLTEFSPSELGVRLVVPDNSGSGGGRRRKQQNAVLVVKGMGDWKRYGILPLRVAHTGERENAVSLTLETLQGFGGNWDGQVHIEVSRVAASDADDDEVRVRVVLTVPKDSQAHTVSEKIALTVVRSLRDSISASITTRTKQSLARKLQSSRYQATSNQRARDRRQTRFDKTKKLEEMASDRRRRWQRSNPNSGHYRPSGERMRSPNNAVYT